MVLASDFYARPALGMCEIFSQVLNIYVDHFKTFAILGVLQALSFIPVFIVFIFVIFVAFAAEMVTLQTTLNNGVRRLYESTSNYNSNYEQKDPFQTMADQGVPEGLGSFLVAIVAIYLCYVVVIICISSVFQGAFIRATGEVFSGRSPSVNGCLHFGWQKMCSIVGFQLLFLVLVAVFSLVWFGLMLGVPAAVGNGPGFASIFISILVFILFFIYVSASMTGGLTAIMVENKGAVSSVKRSWQLCKSNLLFIFCSTLVFYILEFAVRMIFRLVLGAVFSGPGPSDGTGAIVFASWIVILLIGPLNAILNPVLYFALRIRNEGLNMEELQHELGLNNDSIELSGGDGIYSKVSNPAVCNGKGLYPENEEKTPIATATAV